MENVFHEQKVTVILEKDGPLYRRITKYAEAEGVSVEAVIDSMITVGAKQLMTQKIKEYEKAH